MQIDTYLTFDFVCPWCYIGANRLLIVLNSLPKELQVNLQFKPFEFNPQMPADGVDLKEYMVSKYNLAHFEAMQKRVSAIGNHDGILLDYNKVKRLPNTGPAHQLVIFAQSYQKESVFVLAVFKAYFSLGKDIGNPNILADLVNQIGLNGDEALKFLDEKTAVTKVKQLEQQAAQNNINGVPHFLVGDVELFGAQPVEILQETFLQLAAEIET